MSFKMWRHSDFMGKGLIAILASLFIATLAATTYLTYTTISLNSLIQQNSAQVQSANSLQDLLLNLRQAESGQRGYIITGNDKYLIPYRQAAEGMLQAVKTLEGQPNMAPYDQELGQLAALSRQRVSDLDQAIKARQDGGYQAAADIVVQTGSSLLTAKINALTTKIGDQSAKAIAPKQAQSRQNLKRSQVVTVILDIFVLSMCVVIIRYFQRAIARERAIEGAKNEFLSLASHQLRTPATSVKQYIGMLQDGFFGNVTPEQREALAIAYASNETGISIINSLLNAAKLSLGKIQLARKPVVVADIVQEVVDECKGQVGDKRQSIAFSNDLKRRKARLDAMYFKTVLENLVDNAIKYSPEGAAIHVRLRLMSDKKRFAVIVTDNGIGINKQDVHKLFLKFSRLQNEYSETSEGSGLGLYWVKQVIELHGGKVDVRPNPGGGSRFRVILPL